MNKPPYRVPLMAEIAKSRGTSGLKMLSTFSGCGGSCLGFEMAGFDVLWASEFVEAAREVYELNHPGVPVDPRDIRDVDPIQLLDDLGLEQGQVDVLEGSPPCSSFSTAGKGSRFWGKVVPYSDTKQRVDDLFDEYIRILRGIKPRAFVAENVSGLARGAAKGYFLHILEELSNSGYNVNAKLLDAQWLGVPQVRKRIIFIGIRDDLGFAPHFPRPLSYQYSIEDALPHLLDEEKGTRLVPKSDESSIEGLAIGEEWKTLKPGEQSDRYFNLVRPDPSKPVPTVTQTGHVISAASVTHPFECRKFRIDELKRLCAFPDDFEMVGSYANQWERLGRAVPPVMMYHVAKALRDSFRGLDSG